MESNLTSSQSNNNTFQEKNNKVNPDKTIKDQKKGISSEGLAYSYSLSFRNKKVLGAIDEAQMSFVDCTSGSIWTVKHHILAGHALCMGIFDEERRKNANWKGTSLIAVDIDTTDGLSIEEYIDRRPIIKKFGSFYYTTPSHKDATPRFRVVFRLPYLITNAKTFRAVVTFFLEQCGGDKACKDLCRIYYGNTNTTLVDLNSEEVTISKDLIYTAECLAQAAHSNAQSKIKSSDYSLDRDFELIGGTLLPFIAEKNPRKVGEGIDSNYEMWLHILAGAHSKFADTKYADSVINLFEQYLPNGISKKGSIRSKWASFSEKNDDPRTFGSIIHYYRKLGGNQDVLPKATNKNDTKIWRDIEEDTLKNSQECLEVSLKIQLQEEAIRKTEKELAYRADLFNTCDLSELGKGHKKLDEKYLPKVLVNPNSALLVISPVGTGKTTLAIENAKQAINEGGLVICLAPTEALGRNIVAKCESENIGAVHLNDIKPKIKKDPEYLLTFNGVVVACPESVHYFESHLIRVNSLLIIDEVSTSINTLETSSTNEGKEISSCKNLRELCSQLQVTDGKILMMENHITETHIKYLQEVLGGLEELRIIENTYKPENPPKVTTYKDRLALIRKINDYETAYVTTDSINQSKKLALGLGKDCCLTINKNTRNNSLVQEYIKDSTAFHKAHPEIKYVICTPTIKIGVDVRYPYDAVFGLCSHLSSRDFIQMLGRVRNPKLIHIWLNPEIGSNKPQDNTFNVEDHKRLLRYSLPDKAATIAKALAEDEASKDSEKGNPRDQDWISDRTFDHQIRILNGGNEEVIRHVQCASELAVRANQGRYNRVYDVLTHYHTMGCEITFNTEEATKEERKKQGELKDAVEREEAITRANTAHEGRSSEWVDVVLEQEKTPDGKLAVEDDVREAIKHRQAENHPKLVPFLDDPELHYNYYIENQGKRGRGLKTRTQLQAYSLAHTLAERHMIDNAIFQYGLNGAVSPGGRALNNLAKLELLNKLDILGTIHDLEDTSYDRFAPSVWELICTAYRNAKDIYCSLGMKVIRNNYEDLEQFGIAYRDHKLIDTHTKEVLDPDEITNERFPRWNPKEGGKYSKTAEEAVFGQAMALVNKLFALLGYETKAVGRPQVNGVRIRQYAIQNYRNVMDTINVRAEVERIRKKVACEMSIT